jgi:hypothetical protein
LLAGSIGSAWGQPAALCKALVRDSPFVVSCRYVETADDKAHFRFAPDPQMIRRLQRSGDAGFVTEQFNLQLLSAFATLGHYSIVEGFRVDGYAVEKLDGAGCLGLSGNAMEACFKIQESADRGSCIFDSIGARACPSPQ